jgi:hypothetical protein
MKKAVWVSLASYAATTLDTNISSHDCDSLATSKLLEQAGYEVWLIQPYKIAKKQSSYPRALTLDEAYDMDWDLVVIWSAPASVDQSLSGPWHVPAVEKTCEFIKKNSDHAVYNLNDPRPTFHKMLEGKGGKHWAHEMIAKLPVLVPVKGLISDPGREIVSEYWKMLDWTAMPFNPEAKYGSVYVGLKNQTPTRKKVIKRWFEDSTDGYLGGPVNLPGIPSLSDHKEIMLAQTVQFARDSRTVLVCGEYTHTWLTPRAIQAFICGTIASIGSDFPGRHCIPDDILAEQTCDRLVDFDNALRTEEVYQRQVEFVSGLSQSALPLAV